VHLSRFLGKPQGFVLTHLRCEVGGGITMHRNFPARAPARTPIAWVYVASPVLRPARPLRREPHRLTHSQFQVIFCQALLSVDFLTSIEEPLRHLRHHLNGHDFVLKNDCNPRPSLMGICWQFCSTVWRSPSSHFSQAAGIDLDPISVELTYGSSAFARFFLMGGEL